MITDPLPIRQSRLEPLAATATLQFVFLVVFTVITVTARFTGAWIAMSLALAGMLFSRQKVRFPPAFWWGVALLAWGLISSFVAMLPDVAFATLETRLKVMLIFLVIMNAIRSERQLWVYSVVYIGAFLLYPARGTLLNYLHHDLVTGRVSWNQIYSNPNDDAAMAILATGVALSIAMAEVQSTKVRRGAAICAATFVLVVLVTESRGAFIGLALGIFLPLIRTLKRRTVVLYAVVGICVGVAVLPKTFWARIEGLKDLTSISTIRKADKSGSAEQRWQIQKTAMHIFIDHPILGVGLGCYPFANAKYRPDLGPRDAHDTYLRLAAELGIPGLLLWGGLVLSILKQVKRAEHGKARLQTVNPVWLKYGVIAFLIEGAFGSYSDLSALYLLLGAMWSAAIMMLSQAEPEQVVRPARAA
jgi:O-antigen ligase